MKRAITLLSFLLITTLSFGQLLINEVLYDPPSGTAGDANGDGTRDPNEDEFLEMVNMGATALDLTGWEIYDLNALSSGIPRHVFPAGSILGPDSAIVIFGGGTPTGTFGGALVQTASSGDINMTNAGDSIVIYDDLGNFVIDFDITPLSNNPDESYTRFPDLTGSFIQHADTTSLLFSPGTYVDGTTPFTSILVTSITVQGAGGVSTITTAGGTLQMEAMVMPTNAKDPTVTWSVPAGNAVATINATGLLTATGNGAVYVKATANDASGVMDSTEITVSNQIGIHENAISNLKVYPNPAHDVVNIKSDMAIDAVEILSITGQVMGTMVPKSNQINIGHLSTGVYFLKIRSGNHLSVIRITKN